MAGCCASTEPTCACGAKDVVLLACSGASNVGQIANDAAKALEGYGQGSMSCTVSVALQLPKSVQAVRNKPCIAIDGCPTACASKALAKAGVKPAVQVVVTELGIEKHGEFDHSNDDIAKVVGAVVDALAPGQT